MLVAAAVTHHHLQKMKAMKMIPTLPMVLTPQENGSSESVTPNILIRRKTCMGYFMIHLMMMMGGGIMTIRDHGGADILINNRIEMLVWHLLRHRLHLDLLLLTSLKKRT